MKWRVGLKISVVYIFALLALISIGIMSYTTTVKLNSNVGLVEKTKDEIILLNNLITQIIDAESAERGYVISGSEGYLTTYNKAKTELPTTIQELTVLMSTNDQLSIKLKALEGLMTNKIDTLENIVKLRAGSTPEEANKLILEGSGKEEMDQIRDLITDMINDLNTLQNERQSLTDQSTLSLNRIIILGIPFSIVLVSVFAFVVVRNITLPLKETTMIANRIALGDVSITPKLQNRQDEIGDLSRAFSAMIESYSEMAETANKISEGDLSVTVLPKSELDVMGNALSAMVDSLRKIAEISSMIAEGDLNVVVEPKSRKDMMGNALLEMVKSLNIIAEISNKISEGDLTVVVEPKSSKDIMGNSLKTMVKSLKEMTREIIEGVNVIASASSEIMSSTTQVASAAMETASAINETTSSVEEVKQSALVASEKARTVSEVTRNTVQISEVGIRSVEQTVTGMGKIQDQVESIAQSLVRLSEQSQVIGDITTSVNDIAEQSNLLAVNAAIEAAKAGEQGKGFAVVAQEMKVLAEQSKEATAQVRMILNDILKAINSAVIATEQGGKAVEVGVNQSREAGETIKKMVESVDHAAQMVLQIEMTSQQQLVGMDQISQAMENVRKAGEQNVSGTKQVEYTVQNLHELGQRLKHTVDRYKI